jgi:predicted nucleic acid-binding protein
LIVADTSVVIAAFASWHEYHRVALTVLDRRPRLSAQAALETYSVLTRLPPPHRASPTLVRDFLAANFQEPLLMLTPEAHASLISELAEAGVAGGAAYDGLIGAVAREHDVTLVTLDQRARVTYERLGASVEYIG